MNTFTLLSSFKRYSLPFAVIALLVGCDIPGLDGDKIAAEKEADGKAIGSACRHALRGIEDCYRQNPKAVKVGVFAGWKEMDAYMRENKLEGIAPPPPPPPPKKAIEEEDVITEKAVPKGKTKAAH
jgi:hypothetical protein